MALYPFFISPTAHRLGHEAGWAAPLFPLPLLEPAGVQALGVAWGYHRAEELIEAGAASVAMDSAELARHIGLS